MKRSTLLLVLGLATAASAQNISPLTVQNAEGKRAHLFPTVQLANDMGAFNQAAGFDSGPLVYHSGGLIMPSQNVYIIFWAPSKLQNGATATMSAHYKLVQQEMLSRYAGHAISTNNTQYYQKTSAGTKYINNVGGLVASYVDTARYPASQCHDNVTGNNCIDDSAIIAEVQKVMKLKGWKTSASNIFMVFTSKGEGSCIDNGTSRSCAYTDYCAYHSFTNNGTIYSNQPYGDHTLCQTGGVPSPNSDADADTATTAASHELTEAITDPYLDAWFTASGNEIGDLCAYKYTPNTWDGGKANQMWSGFFFELQSEFDNHTKKCAQEGP